MRFPFAKPPLICLGLLLITLAAFWPALSLGFIRFDDTDYVVRNPHVLAGLSWSGLMYALTSWDCSNWHPLTWLSLEADSSLWGTQPFGYHATNLILHAANSMLFFLWLYRVSNSLQASAWTAAFFALHPLHVESVAWVAERKDVLSGFFLLLTLWSYVRYTTRPSWSRYFLVMLVFACGLLAKPMLVTVPILLCFVDRWPLKRFPTSLADSGQSSDVPYSWRSLILEKIPFFVLSFADGLMTISAQQNPVKLMGDVSIPSRIANLFNAYLWYLEKTILPINLTIMYPHPDQSLSWGRIGISVIILLAITTWVWRSRRERPYLLFGWSWFLVSLLPVIGLIQVGFQAYADRYAYIPHMGLLTAVVWECQNRFSSAKIKNVLLNVGSTLALVACAVLTRMQTGYWQSDETLWKHALDVDSKNGLAHAQYADIQMAKGDYESAMFHIELAIGEKRFGQVANTYFNWGLCLLQLSRSDEAEEKFLKSLEQDPIHERALEEMAKLRAAQGRPDEAKVFSARQTEAFKKRIAAMPEDAGAQFQLGIFAMQQNNPQQALKHFEKVVQLAPDSAEARVNQAIVLMQLKRAQEAKAHFLRALELNPNLAMAHYFMGVIQETEGDLAGAKMHYSEAARHNPKYLKSKQALERLSKP